MSLVKVISGQKTPISANQTVTLQIDIPPQMFLGYDIPDGMKVFHLGNDLAGIGTQNMKFYNSEAATVDVTLFIRPF